MKKKKMKVETKTKEVERIKCDDCGVVDDEDGMNVLACDPDTIEVQSSYNGTRRQSEGWKRMSFGHMIYRQAKGYELDAEWHLDLCDECLDKYLHDGEAHEQCSIDRELEREMA